jgi:protein ImuA
MNGVSTVPKTKGSDSSSGCSPLQKLQEQGLLWSSAGLSTSPATSSLSANAPSLLSSVLGTPKLAASAACFGIAEIDLLLPAQGLPSGSIHEWALTNSFACKERYIWHPPLSILASMLGHTLRQKAHDTTNPIQHSALAWVGRKCWPSPHLLAKTLHHSGWSWQEHCLFIDPPDKEKRLWTLIQTLRSSSVFAVIGDASGFNETASRRLQLAAEHGNTLGMMIRPPWELALSSSAYSKWNAQPIFSATESLRWNLQLTRLRGSLRSSIETSPNISQQREWPILWDFTDGTLSLRSSDEHRIANEQEQTPHARRRKQQAENRGRISLDEHRHTSAA